MKLYLVIYMLSIWSLCRCTAYSERCSVYSINSTDERVVSKVGSEGELWFRPQDSFEIFFALEVNYIMNRQPPFVSEKLSIGPQLLGKYSGNWTKLQFRVYKKDIPLWGDKLSIEVSLPNETHNLVLDLWWRTHQIQNVLISATGVVEIAIDCNPESASEYPDPEKFTANNSIALLIVVYCIAPTVLIIILVMTAVFLCKKHQHRRYNAEEKFKCTAPKLCEEFALQRMHNPDIDNIYEEIPMPDLIKCRGILEADVDQPITERDTLRIGSNRWKRQVEELEKDQKVITPYTGIYDVPTSKPRTTDAIYLDMSGSRRSVADGD